MLHHAGLMPLTPPASPDAPAPAGQITNPPALIVHWSGFAGSHPFRKLPHHSLKSHWQPERSFALSILTTTSRDFSQKAATTDTETPCRDSLSPNACEVFAYLCSMLPLAGASAEVRAARDQQAMKAVFACIPTTTRGAARRADRCHGRHSAEGLRLAGLAVNDAAEARRCLAQAALMARQSDLTLRLLVRMQAQRDKAFAAMHPGEMDRVGYWFREAGAPRPRIATRRTARRPESQPTPAQIDADAELYEVMYPDRARRIRAAGGLPPDLDFGPPGPAIIATLLKRNSRIRQAERKFRSRRRSHTMR